MGIPLTGAARSSPDKAYASAVKRGAKDVKGQPGSLRAYFDHLYEDAAELGINADVLVAQWDLETGSGTSAGWVQSGNPAGLGMFDDGSTMGLRFNPEHAARAHVTHMALYLGIEPDDPWIKTDARWDAAMNAGYFGSVETTADLGNGRWATDPLYPSKLLGRYAAYFGAAPIIVAEETTMAKPFILITAGHRSTGDPGNPTEKDRTDDMARAYLAAFRAAGYDVKYWQSELDRDSTPDMTVGDLETVATGVRNVFLGRSDPMAIMLDLHFNGPESTLFTIVPDCVGLRSGYSDGAPADDTAANNTLDVTVAQTISQKIGSRLGGKALFNGRLGVKGVMSERETGVALDGSWRLGMFGSTAVVRSRVVRLVVEHGGYNDFTRYSDFPAKCAAGALEAINEVFNVATTPPISNPTIPTPVPVPGPTPLAYPAGMDGGVAAHLFGEAKANSGALYKFDPNGDISRAWLAHGQETGSYPRLESVQVYSEGKPDQRQYFQFSDGWVTWRPSIAEPFRDMGA